ncbi:MULTISPECIES: signal peptidase II [Paenibacillus]|uniref:Lipoprotein signal peptidase n=1 Tax=Paenibacillus albilobatus TaxID=2716884 RepID=A0A920C8W7_9BACL|nr:MULTISPECIES: signal peptidase II [Paenibacillus]MDR9852979.1 signal peptidase II [Paenibacillus sp. VCA1]GIO30566.1 lipoprotein signal peptidase [Paenibacillus albilobatus]
MWYYILAIIAFLVDQGTKFIIAKQLEIGQEIPVIGNFFVITSSRNRGAAFGILPNQRWFFIVITIVVVIAIIWYMQKVRKTSSRKLLPAALSLVLGGAIGNFLDRALNGEVVDFLMFNFGSYTFPIFNIADSCIVVGVALIILDSLIDLNKTPKEEGSGEGNEIV